MLFATILVLLGLLPSVVLCNDKDAPQASETMLFHVEERLKRNEGWVVVPDNEYEQLLGTHYVFELSNITLIEALKDAARMEDLVIQASAAGGLEVLKSTSVKFEGKGAGTTAMAVLAESHISLHTWPEHRFVSADVFTCGREMGAKATVAFLAEAIGGDLFISARLPRGVIGKMPLVEKFYGPRAAQNLLDSENDDDGKHQTVAKSWANNLGLPDLELLFGNTRQDWNTIEVKRSEYQTIEFIQEATTNDVCLVLDNTIQICDSHNSGYSEVYVHLPIAFLPTVEKALIIGGGDGLALRELLKYKSIKRVVQLELDRTVVEMCEKYFKIKSHLPGNPNADPRVEWIFGDAAKTIEDLLDAGERFDVVLLDISETDPSGTVSTLDFFRSVARTLKPTGVFIKNGHYEGATSVLFEHVVEVIYPVPVIGSQTFIIGSNGTSLYFPTFEIFEDEGISTNYLSDGPQDKFAQYRTMLRRYTRSGLNYEVEAAQKYYDLTGTNPYDMASEGERHHDDDAECEDPSLKLCHEDHLGHPDIVHEFEWSSKNCNPKLPHDHPVKVTFSNKSPLTLNIMWVSVTAQGYEEDMLILKGLDPGKSKTVTTFIGHRFRLVEHSSPYSVVKEMKVVQQLVTHSSVDIFGFKPPLVAKRSAYLTSVLQFPLAPSPSDHDENVAQNDGGHWQKFA